MIGAAITGGHDPVEVEGGQRAVILKEVRKTILGRYHTLVLSTTEFINRKGDIDDAREKVTSPQRACRN